jgi:hypothetical protein
LNYIPSGSVSILLGNGDGTFRAGPSYAVAVQPFYLAAADLRHKGTLDLVVGDSLSYDVYVMLDNGDGKLDIIALAEPGVPCNCLEVLPGNGNGTFGPAIITPRPNNIAAYAFGTG